MAFADVVTAIFETRFSGFGSVDYYFVEGLPLLRITGWRGFDVRIGIGASSRVRSIFRRLQSGGLFGQTMFGSYKKKM